MTKLQLFNLFENKNGNGFTEKTLQSMQDQGNFIEQSPSHAVTTAENDISNDLIETIDGVRNDFDFIENEAKYVLKESKLQLS